MKLQEACLECLQLDCSCALHQSTQFMAATHISCCRATITPFLANKTAGIDSYKWMLFGDDDTTFFVDNALRLLETLDHTIPYILSDHMWFPTDLKSGYAKPACPFPCELVDSSFLKLH